MKILILLISLRHVVISTIYNVIPDDHNSTCNCNHCHTLQHYLLNISKYFTSNTQLLFQPGLYHLHDDLIIQNVHNISLIGSTANGTTLNTVIQCNKLPSIEIANVSNITIQNLMLQRELSVLNSELLEFDLIMVHSSINIRDCINISVDHLQIHLINYNSSSGEMELYPSLQMVNILGKSQLSHILCYKVQITYTDTEIQNNNNVLLINDYQTQNEFVQNEPIINLYIEQTSYSITVQISNTTVVDYLDLFISFQCDRNVSPGIFELIINNCKFKNNNNIIFELQNCVGNKCNTNVYFKNCYFLNNYAVATISYGVTLKITNCAFYDNIKVLKPAELAGIHTDLSTTINISNTIFSNINVFCRLYDTESDLINLKHTDIFFTGTVAFTNITCKDAIISLEECSKITIGGLLKFSNNHVNKLINIDRYSRPFIYVVMKNSLSLEITHNNICRLFTIPVCTYEDHPSCFFQYITNEAFNKTLMHRNFTIAFYYNKHEATKPYSYKSKYISFENSCMMRNQDCFTSIPITNCRWETESAFMNIIPQDVNKQYIKYFDGNHSTINSLSFNQSSLCVCVKELVYDCNLSELGYLYPGQTLTVFLHRANEELDSDPGIVMVKTDILFNPCTLVNVNEHQQIIGNYCTTLTYTIAFPSEWCYMYLEILEDLNGVNVFTIRKLKCPPGFTEISNICQCDTAITSFIIITCNINNQTILRPANIWISTTTCNNSYTYQIATHCPFHYCLPHSSHHNISTPNSQCQYNRSGLLCGQCQRGLSSVFGSPYCQKCSNIYILLITPIAIAGLILVFLIFRLNLTVTDGSINAFILYTNIININTSVFFSSTNELMPFYTFISLANLDLGIPTCFYNGMDEYAKMWLQLSFPFYLLFIAILLIITSRHSIAIQRFTACRALPVLATIFLLSYTKMLQTVSSTLFFYSTITYLPSKHTTLVWSVDANVPLFGIKFTILFIVCLILFLILVIFNIVLLFTRTLSRFRCINKFKPILDAYQGPYKDKLYFWTGLQLLLRAILFGLSSLDRNVNLMIGLIVLSIFGGIAGVVQPFKNKIKTYQELILLFNLHGMYAISLYAQEETNPIIINTMIALSAVHFVFIFTYHIITYACGGVFKDRLVSMITRWITKSQSRLQHQNFILEETTKNKIPEVTHQYNEYREPLMGCD